MTTTIGTVYVYRNGQREVEFRWDGARREGYVWDTHAQCRIKNYRTLRELRAAYARSSNNDGAYGCAQLSLDDE